MDQVSSSKGSVLVTGGSGFIGQALCTALLAEGYDVWVLSRDPALARRRLGQGVQIVGALAEVKGRAFDALINLAGQSLADRRWSEAIKNQLRSSRIDFTQALIDFFSAQELFPRTVINASAIGVYGDTGAQAVDELSPIGEGFAAQLCRDWEAKAQRFEAHGARVCIVRIGIVLGADGGALAQMLPPFKLGLGGRMGSGEQYMSWIHRTDLVQLFIHLLRDKSASGVFNGTAPEPVTNRVFTACLAKCLGRPAFLPMPAFVLRLMFGEMADSLLLSGQCVLPKNTQAQGFSFQYPVLLDALNNIVKK